MSYCLNPDCQKPYNPQDAKFCQGCGAKLLLGDRYRALKPIGQGGFGRTFVAVDQYKPSQPRCVIKQFFPQVQGANQAEKAASLFRQEALRLDQLGKHPQIPELLAHFEQDKRQYLVQEFIDGQHLGQELEQTGAFSEVQIWQLLNALLPALEFIHSHQVIHRDIKPENIIRRTDGRLFIVDFGAARFTPSPVLSQMGTVIGSAGYSAPEQAVGKPIFASDLYSVGVTCVHLLTQIDPFDLFDASEGHWVWQDYLTQPLSPGLIQILDKLLQPKVQQRFQSVSEVLQAIQEIANTPVTTVPPAPAQTSGTSRSLFAKIFGASPYYLKGNMLHGLGKLDEALAAYDQAIQAKPDYPEAWYKKGYLLWQVGRTEEALAAYDQVVQLKPNHIEAWCIRGVLLYSLKRFEAAIASYDKSLQLKPESSVVWLYRSLALKQSGAMKEALLSFEQAKQHLPEGALEQVDILIKGWDLLMRY